MKRTRVIPILLLQNNGLVKTVRFKNPTYIGDPINAVKIFNEKEVDELAFLDIEAGVKRKEPDYSKIEEIASECFMPLAYGGGIRNLNQIKKIFAIGVEKVILNSVLVEQPALLSEAASIYGSQSIVASVDVKKDLLGKLSCFSGSGKHKIKIPLFDYVKQLENAGAGELILTSIDREGTFKGYDIELIRNVSSVLNIPVVANGGASKVEDFTDAVLTGGASAVAAGSFFVYKSQNRGILINYPTQNELKDKVFGKIL